MSVAEWFRRPNFRSNQHERLSGHGGRSCFDLNRSLDGPAELQSVGVLSPL